MGFLNNKRALITGVAGNRSIAWGIAQAMHREGAEIALTYQNEKLTGRVRELGKECDVKILLPCDVSSDEQIQTLFDHLKQSWEQFDILVHSLAFAPRESLNGDFVENTSRESFTQAHEISAYSLTALAKCAKPFMLENGGSILTLTYLGAERAVPNYNVMGLAKASLEANVRYLAASLGPDNIRVNAISAGPIKTLAASGIKDFRKMLAHTAETAPLKRNITLEEIGNTGAFLGSELASGITGSVIYVDAGFHAAG